MVTKKIFSCNLFELWPLTARHLIDPNGRFFVNLVGIFELDSDCCADTGKADCDTEVSFPESEGQCAEDGKREHGEDAFIQYLLRKTMDFLECQPQKCCFETFAMRDDRFEPAQIHPNKCSHIIGLKLQLLS